MNKYELTVVLNVKLEDEERAAEMCIRDSDKVKGGMRLLLVKEIAQP